MPVELPACTDQNPCLVEQAFESVPAALLLAEPTSRISLQTTTEQALQAAMRNQLLLNHPRFREILLQCRQTAAALPWHAACCERYGGDPQEQFLENARKVIKDNRDRCWEYYYHSAAGPRPYKAMPAPLAA